MTPNWRTNENRGMRTISGRCHCGNIRYEFLWPDAGFQIPVRACSCTFCQQHGGVYTSHPDAQLIVHIKKPTHVNPYTFGTRTAEFHICKICGAIPFVTSTIDEQRYAVVNVNTFEDVARSELISSVTDFDDEDVASRLDRRKRKWTPRVEIDYGHT